mmetsp:Transcript_8738/g.24656  ORF Transcript_8738/g.24656 Transcript_8738/m.24656 type:complete len:111 (+) Transcript_8738:56-388(+)
MADILKKWRELEAFCNGCRNECDQKCVIDNHEVEILQSPGFEIPNCTEHAFCPSGRAAADLCTPRNRAAPASFRTRTASGLGAAQFQGVLGSERSRMSTPGRCGAAVRPA